MAQSAEDDEALPVTLLRVLDHEAFLIQKIPPKAKSSMVLCEQWPHRSPKDDPKIVIPIQIELIDKNKNGLWMYLKRRKPDTNEYETYLHFVIDRELPTVEQAYDSSRYFQLSIPKPGGSKNEMIYMGLREDSKQLQDEINTYWRALDNAREVQEMPEADWTLSDDTQISIGGKGASEQKAPDANKGNAGAAVLPLAGPGKAGKSRKGKKNKGDANKVESSSDPKNQPKQSVFDDNFGNDFDNAFGATSTATDAKDKDATAGTDAKDGKDAAVAGGSGWTDFDF